MVAGTSQNQQTVLKGRGLIRRLLQLAGFLLLTGALLFGGSGRLDWTGAWIFLGIYVGIIGVNALIFLPRRDTGLIDERSRLKENVKRWDRVLAPLVTLIGMLGVLLVAAFDLRWGWGPRLSLPWMILGTVLYAGGYALVDWAMVTNRFFSSYVRIQADRGHTVVDGGPYRLVRHPGYLGMFLAMPGIALLLGSLWALVPVAIGSALLVTRTALEDRTLRSELPGYEEFTGKVRFRLFPGLW